MKNYFRYIFVVWMLAIALISCNKEKGAEGEGYLKLNIDKDESLIVIGTKAEENPIYQVSVWDNKGQMVASYDNHNDLVASPLKLKAGKYIVVGSTGENGGYAAFDKPVPSKCGANF